MNPLFIMFIVIVIIIGIIVFISIKRWQAYNKVILENSRIMKGWQKPIGKVKDGNK